jgi:hypothetical protein
MQGFLLQGKNGSALTGFELEQTATLRLQVRRVNGHAATKSIFDIIACLNCHIFAKNMIYLSQQQHKVYHIRNYLYSFTLNGIYKRN